MRFRALLALALPLLALAACGTKTLVLSSFDGSKTATVNIEIADSPEEREKGLMNRSKMESDTGMLFAFPEPQMMAFWMKNTLIPLEILYFDKDGNFINSLAMEPCTKDPCPQYKAAAQAQYALEVNPGFREKNEIGTGWRLNVNDVKSMAKPK